MSAGDSEYRTALGKMSDDDMLELGAFLMGVEPDDVAAVAIVVETKSGVGLSGSSSVSYDASMIALLSAGIIRSAKQIAADGGAL